MTTSSFELDTFPEDTDTAPDRGEGIPCQVPGCTETVKKPARGRPSKYCDTHKGGKAATASSAPRKPAGQWAAANSVENALNQIFGYAGMGLQLVNPKDAAIVVSGGPAVSKALVDLARTDKKLRGILETIASPGKYGPLTMAVLGIAVPVMVNHGVIPQLSIFSTNETERGEEK